MVKRILFILAFLVTNTAFAQLVSPAAEESAYAQAISEYLKATSKRHGYTFDTLLVGKRHDFPVVTLPPKVDNTVIVFLTPKETDKKRKYNPKLIFVNLAGIVTKESSNFIFVTFYPGYTHQYDCMIDLKYNAATHAYDLDQLNFKNYAYK